MDPNPALAGLLIILEQPPIPQGMISGYSGRKRCQLLGNCGHQGVAETVLGKGAQKPCPYGAEDWGLEGQSSHLRKTLGTQKIIDHHHRFPLVDILNHCPVLLGVDRRGGAHWQEPGNFLARFRDCLGGLANVAGGDPAEGVLYLGRNSVHQFIHQLRLSVHAIAPEELSIMYPLKQSNLTWLGRAIGQLVKIVESLFVLLQPEFSLRPQAQSCSVVGQLEVAVVVVYTGQQQMGVVVLHSPKDVQQVSLQDRGLLLWQASGT
mmetsp:Transcript_49549/g.130622  ORF Transcript_49549/g.130622 Transcript_49549/m.130622 type:complete len:263 (+) Transcript_49549:690-1478(+)